jgi:tetratricopeptide (TPR) repeat protein
MATPSLPEFQFEIGARMGRGDWGGAAAAAAGCRAAWPADSAGWLLGSIAALFADKKETALALVEERLVTDPSDVQCLLQKAECLLALGRRAEAIACADEAALNAAKDRNAVALDAVGTFLVYAAAHSRALEIYNQAVDADPKSVAIVGKRAEVHRFLGNFDLSARDHETVLTLSPMNPDALKGLSELRQQTADHNSVAAMETALAGAPLESEDVITLHYGLAKSYEDLGEHAASWRHLGAANKLQRGRFQYDPAHERAVIDRIIGGFPDLEPIAADTTGEEPIFIVGLPRTGTTLVERILGNHSQVHSAGELQALSESIGAALDRKSAVEDWLGYASALGGLDGESIAREYLARSRSRRGEKARFSDKQTANFFYCALILRAFPKARIVHVTRHPLAACYAIYKTRFYGTFTFGNDLAELGDFYVDYRRLMAHWHGIVPGRILDLAYEDVVSALEPTTRRLLDYVGLPFEESCLEFHRNPAATMTASSVQVRKPLYDSSLQQWRNYAGELAPLRARLEAAGISVD